MSIRCDTVSLFGSGIVCGGPGLGILGSVLLATTGGVSGGPPGILYNDVQPGDENKEFRIQITTPTAAPIFIYEDGTFVFTSASPDSLEYMIIVDGQTVAGSALVTLYASQLSDFWYSNSGVPTRSLGLQMYNGTSFIKPSAKIWNGAAWQSIQ